MSRAVLVVQLVALSSGRSWQKTPCRHRNELHSAACKDRARPAAAHVTLKQAHFVMKKLCFYQTGVSGERRCNTSLAREWSGISGPIARLSSPSSEGALIFIAKYELQQTVMGHRGLIVGVGAELVQHLPRKRDDLHFLLRDMWGRVRSCARPRPYHCRSTLSDEQGRCHQPEDQVSCTLSSVGCYIVLSKDRLAKPRQSIYSTILPEPA